MLFLFCSTSNAFWTQMNTSNLATSKSSISAMKLKQKWRAMTFNILKLLIFNWFFDVFGTLLKTRFELLLKIPNCCRSWNAIKTNEELWQPWSISTPNEELINIHQLSKLSQSFWSLLEAWFQYFATLPTCRISMHYKMQQNNKWNATNSCNYAVNKLTDS